MYEEFLGEGYHEKLRKMLTVDDTLLPNRIIDADANIGAMKRMIQQNVGLRAYMVNRIEDNSQEYDAMKEIATYYLAGVLCTALKSRTSVPPFNVPRYKRDWEKKRSKYIDKGNGLLIGLIRMG
jgi:hypothetical protein